MRPPRHDLRKIRGLELHLTRWGPDPSPAAPPILLLHGWQDTGATFQFLVDAFSQEWPLMALDWRGFGRSEWPRDGYWFADYFADLDALLDELSPTMPVPLIGHSMGGNIASLYAGIRPDRVRCVVDLEGFGLPRSNPAAAPAQMRRWLGQVKTPPVAKDYESFERLADIILARYPRFSAAQAQFVAHAWARLEADGRVHLLGDPRHRWSGPTPYKREDSEAIWREVTAPVLLLLGMESEYLANLGDDGTDQAFHAIFSRIEIVRIAATGHMLHIEKADVVAPLIERFLRAHAAC